jgi:hypothetical protein
MRGYTAMLEEAERFGITVDEVIENRWTAAEDENDRRRDDAMCERYERDMRAQEVANDI